MPDDTQPYSGPERRQSERRSFYREEPLDAAIARLTKFRETWESGDLVDEFSHLTADDLDLILAELNGSGDAG